MNICYVCTGNACRSPFAECVTKALLEHEPLAPADVQVYSCGTYDWGMHNRDSVMVKVAQEMGYQLTGVTTYMTRELLMKADLIITFSHAHRDAITRILDYSHWNRIVLFSQLAFGVPEEVVDPNFQTTNVYHRVAQQIEEGCRNIVHKLLHTDLSGRTQSFNSQP